MGFFEGRKSQGEERDCHQAKTDTANETGPDYPGHADIQIIEGGEISAECSENDAHQHDIAWIDATSQHAPREHHGDHGTDTLRCHHQSRGKCLIAHQTLQHDGQNHHGSEEGETKYTDPHAADGQIPVFEQTQIHYGIGCAQRAPDEKKHTQNGADGQDDDGPRTEPVILITQAQHALQAAQPYGH